MPEICVGERRWAVPTGSNLLDALNEAGLNVPYSCRAGSCHACLVHCLAGQPLDALPEALALDKHALGWRLACQCRVVEDLQVALFDPQRDGVPAHVGAALCRERAAQQPQLILRPAAQPGSKKDARAQPTMVQTTRRCFTR